MTRNGKIALVVYTALFLLVTKVRRVINGLQFRFNGLQLLSTFAGGWVSNVRLNLLIRNPLPFSVTIDSIKGKLYAQGVRMTSYENDVNITTPIDIKGRSITPVSLDFVVDWHAIGEAVKQNILSGDISTFTLQFVGTITVNNHTFNVSKTISYYDLVGVNAVPAGMVSDGVDRLMKVGVNSDVVTSWQEVYPLCCNQPAKLFGNDLKNATTDEKCRAIFNYLTKHVRYRLDDYGSQYIKTPARLLADGEGDCKSLTMFIASCLHCVGVPCKVRFVNFDGGRQYTHVYPVAIDENGREIILDACELDRDGKPIYNYAREYVRKKDLSYE